MSIDSHATSRWAGETPGRGYCQWPDGSLGAFLVWSVAYTHSSFLKTPRWNAESDKCVRALVCRLSCLQSRIFLLLAGRYPAEEKLGGEPTDWYMCALPPVIVGSAHFTVRDSEIPLTADRKRSCFTCSGKMSRFAAMRLHHQKLASPQKQWS